MEEQQTSPYGDHPYYDVPKKKKRSYKRGVLTGVLCTALVFGILAGIFFGVFYHSASDVLDDATEEKLGLLHDIISTYYYQDVPEDDLSTGVLKGMVEGLDDPYSVYYTKEEYDEFLVDATGKYAGIGAVLQKDAETGRVSVVNVYEGSPAEEAGIKKGDLIVSADGFDAVSEELSAFVQHIRGEEGTTVTLSISREGETMDVEVIRRPITVPSVSYRMLENENGESVIGYIQIMEFSEGTTQEFEDALADLQAQGMTGVIYDVRDNPGGMLSAVTDMLDDILGEGITVYMIDSMEKRTDYTSDEATKLDLPTVVLVNGNSASASEIFSGAIRDFHYGKLVGTKTYGKGVVQNTFPLRDGSAVKLTIASYYTPSGESIQGVGITPDIELDYEYTGDEDGDYDYYKDNQVTEAIRILSK